VPSLLQTLMCSCFPAPGAVLEQWSKGVNTHFSNHEQRPFPRERLEQFCEAIYPVFRYATVNWLDGKEEEVSRAAFHAWGLQRGCRCPWVRLCPVGCEQRGEGREWSRGESIPSRESASSLRLGAPRWEAAESWGLSSGRAGVPAWGNVLSSLERALLLQVRREGKLLPVGRQCWCLGDAERSADLQPSQQSFSLPSSGQASRSWGSGCHDGDASA